MTQMRKGIAAQMTRALAAPHAYVQMEIDASRLVRLRESLKKAYQAKEGVGISYVPFVVKAAAEALKRNPTFNAHWTDQGLLAKRRINDRRGGRRRRRSHRPGHPRRGHALDPRPQPRHRGRREPRPGEQAAAR